MSRSRKVTLRIGNQVYLVYGTVVHDLGAGLEMFFRDHGIRYISKKSLGWSTDHNSVRANFSKSPAIE
jgi:hypothetical protein